MRAEDAMRKHIAWGDKPCSHPEIVKEYVMGMQSGDYACTTCGLAQWGSDWNKKQPEPRAHLAMEPFVWIANDPD